MRRNCAPFKGRIRTNDFHSGRYNSPPHWDVYVNKYSCASVRPAGLANFKKPSYAFLVSIPRREGESTAILRKVALEPLTLGVKLNRYGEDT
jgi:hypothetical protein